MDKRRNGLPKSSRTVKRQRRVLPQDPDLGLAIPEARDERTRIWLVAVGLRHRRLNCRGLCEMLLQRCVLRFAGFKTVRYVLWSFSSYDWIIIDWVLTKLLECEKESRKDRRRGPSLGTRTSHAERTPRRDWAPSSRRHFSAFQISKERSPFWQFLEEIKGSQFTWDVCSVTVRNERISDWRNYTVKIETLGWLTHFLRYVWVVCDRRHVERIWTNSTSVRFIAISGKSERERARERARARDKGEGERGRTAVTLVDC